MNNYEIYPLPQEITYLEKVFTLPKEIAIICETTIDEITKQKIESVLQKQSITYFFSDRFIKGNKHLLIGTNDSGEFVDLQTDKQNDFTQIDAYELRIDEELISIIGKDSDAAFYGIVTLEAILKQMTNQTIQCLHIKDYSNTKVRGVIEGFYGIPWSNADRESLIAFGGQFKANTFVFAPKDDPYHREQWAELYPEEKLVGIRSLAKIGNETKNRFVWTISPLGEVASLAREKGEAAAMDLIEPNTKKLIRKFNQLHDAGVRQFGVLGDDIGSLPLEYVVQLMNAVSKWANEKGDVYDTLYCPASYNSGWAWIPEELNAYEKGFAENIHIFWTGSTTCGPVVQSTIDVFKNKDNEGLIRRNPLFWLNWPVNDVDYSRVFLGKGEMLQRNIHDLAGVVTNPMQEAEASKISIFAIADYSWNTQLFNDQKSWEDSLKYIEPHATKELEVIATHMSDAHPNGIQVSESENMKAVIDRIIHKLANGESIVCVADEAIEQLQIIVDSVTQFMLKTKNEKLKEELQPFVYALRDLALADIAFIQASLIADTKDYSSAWHVLSEGLSLHERSKQYDRPMLVGKKKTKPAQKRLQAFTEFLKEKIAKQITNILEIEKPVEKAEIFTNTHTCEQLTIVQEMNTFAIEDIQDVMLAKDEFIGLHLGRVREVTNISAVVENLQVEASINGIEWEEVGEKFHGSARYVRLINMTDEGIHLNFGSWTVTTYEIQPISVKETNFTDYENILSVLDGDLTTSAYFKEHQTQDQFVTYDLGQIIPIESLKVYVGESELDFPRHAVIETSLDGESWTSLLTLGNQDGPNEGEKGDAEKIDTIYNQFIVPYRFKEVTGLSVAAHYLRLRVTVTKIGQVKWMRLQEIVINNGMYYPSVNDPTIKMTGKMNRGYELNHLNDGDITTSFRPLTDESGHLIYHIGEANKEINGITILAGPRNVSNSIISVRTDVGWKKLGIMESTYEHFTVEGIHPIFDLKIEWTKGNIPTIYQVKITK